MDQVARRSRLRTVGIGAAAVLAVSALGGGTFALAQTFSPEARTEETVEVAAPKELTINAVPVAAIVVTATTDLTVSLDGSTSTDADGDILDYLWDFGDGTTAEGVTASHSYAAGGSFTVSLTVIDDVGAESAAQADVTVSAPAPPPPPPPSTPSGPTLCPPGSTANSSDGYNDTSCFPNVCFTIVVPNPDHPECDAPFRP